ncbi:MAG TPA: nucleotide exchange factor GrpE [Pyrinomonadaceae bacterium]|nr:nucleotide exchange factor GrpE [Pyrinomonadaceae bacterium]
MFTKRKMSENDPLIDEFLEAEEGKIPVTDKRRFNEAGERVREDEKPKEPLKSARELQLETQLKAETERREAAEAKLVGVQAKFEEAKQGLEKETADMRARLMKTLEDRAKQGQFSFLTTLLPVLDNLNRAIEASEQDPSLDHLRDGVKGTARSFEQALISVGVETVPAVGSNFDPELHEAIDMAEVDPELDGKVTAEYSRGYKFGDKLLRPARVQVGKVRAQSAME